MNRLPLVAVIGRPNVGKSTLVNRILGRRLAVVREQSGVTRDRREFEADWGGRRFLLVDAGGWEAHPASDLERDIRAQTEMAASQADVVLFVVDARAGPTAQDLELARRLQREGAEVVLAANKVDSFQDEPAAAVLWQLGVGEPIPVSALHGRGSGDLLDAVMARLPASGDAIFTQPLSTLAIVGQPNVGKSTLLNRLLGSARVVVSELPGTTRDPIDVEIVLDGTAYRIVDTAGIGRRQAVGVERAMVSEARRAASGADLGLLVIDSTAGVTVQDQRLAEELIGYGSALVILLNKSDIAAAEARATTRAGVADRLGFASWAPVLAISAKTGSKLNRLPALVARALANRRTRVPTGQLNRWLAEWQAEHPPPSRRGRSSRIQYVTQVKTDPPVIVVFAKGSQPGPDYLRFLERRLREEIDLEGTPVVLTARATHA